MRKITLWKIMISSFTIIFATTSATMSIVSCGEKVTPPPKATWDQFLAKAEAETLSNIVYNAYPSAGDWRFLPNSDLSKIGDFVVNKPFITIKIKSISKEAHASFTISAKNKLSENVYEVDKWSCSVQPIPTPKGHWDIFKKLALAVLPRDLLRQAKTTDAYKKFVWIGNSLQRTWQRGQKAEFDVYGGNGGNDIYKGMSGTPVVSETNHTITAIISIINIAKEGNFDADPIKAVITYKGTPYWLANWVFTQDQQLQSQQKYLQQFIYSFGNIPKPENKNMLPDNIAWLHFVGYNYISNENDQHLSSNSILPYLNAHHVNVRIQIDLETYTDLGPDNNNRMKIILNFKIWKQYGPPWVFALLTLTCYFNFENNSNTNVGAAFNFNWHADIIIHSGNA